MSLKVVFHPEARKEVLAQIEYYNRAVRGLGSRFESAQHETIERIIRYPDRYPVIAQPDIRRLSLKLFPFDIIYRLHKQQIQVLAVASQRRESGYWQVRTN